MRCSRHLRSALWWQAALTAGYGVAFYSGRGYTLVSLGLGAGAAVAGWYAGERPAHAVPIAFAFEMIALTIGVDYALLGHYIPGTIIALRPLLIIGQKRRAKRDATLASPQPSYAGAMPLFASAVARPAPPPPPPTWRP